jgi:Leucine-rich repeat (LRR) protein
MNSFTNSISQNAFANCTTLEHLLIMQNNIPEILGRTFSNSPNLGVAILPFNNIRSISSTAFEGSRLVNLDLEFNELNQIDYAWFTPIQETIRVFRINNNRLNNLNIDSFIRLWNLRELYLNNNPLGSLRYRIFEPMVNLEILQLAGCGLTELDPNYWQRNPMIVNLELDNNNLRDLPVGVFNNTRLVHLGLTGNQLSAIDIMSFGSSLNTLRSLHIDRNNIQAFDETLIDNSPNLDALIAYQNECVDGSLLGVNQNQDRAREFFANCITGFNNITASCEYELFEGMYKCNFNINNPQGRHRFDRITGEHIGNSNDNYVTYVEAIDQFTKTIPSIVCEQFRFLEGMTFTASNVEFISENTFAPCEYLYSLNLMMNRIRIIPPVAFR